MDENWNFQRDEKVQTRNPTMKGVGYPQILSGAKTFSINHSYFEVLLDS